MIIPSLHSQAHQINAVLELVMEDAGERIDDDTIMHALYSVVDNVHRMLEGLDQLTKEDDLKTKVLMELGVLDVYRQRFSEAVTV